jgi:lipid-binding SYLF domain-containing protein
MNTIATRAAAAALTAVFFLAPLPRVLAAGDNARTKDAEQVLADFKETDPGIERFLSTSPGYVVFPSVGKGGLVVGGAHGTGVLFEHGKPTGKAALNQMTIGAQVGGESYEEVIFFETPAAVNDFKRGKYELAAQVSAVALTTGAARNADYKSGVAVFVKTKGGLMADVSVGGQKFSFTPFK